MCLDVSEIGVAFETAADLNVGDTVELEFSQNDQPPYVQQARLAYRLGLRYGAYFSEPGPLSIRTEVKRMLDHRN